MHLQKSLSTTRFAELCRESNIKIFSLVFFLFLFSEKVRGYNIVLEYDVDTFISNLLYKHNIFIFLYIFILYYRILRDHILTFCMTCFIRFENS